MEKKKRSQRARYVYQGFGFPVTLLHVPMIRIRGHWTPDVNYEVLQRTLQVMLAAKSARLSGNQVRFIRLSFEMTLKAFAERFGVTHPAVLKWEKTGNRPTGMAWSTEKDLRLFIVSRREKRPERFLRMYKNLESAPEGKPGPVRLDLSSVA